MAKAPLSFFYGKGKKMTWDTLKCNRGYVETFKTLGELVEQFNRFVCLMYGNKILENVNECRFALFKLGKCSDDLLLPTSDSLLQHIRRANYQTAIWLRCLDAQMEIPPPNGNGWHSHEGQLEIVWSYVGDKIGFQVLARRSRLLWQGSVSRLECVGRVLFVGVALQLLSWRQLYMLWWRFRCCRAALDVVVVL